jgi:epi-isozizaene 5-monooxygenase / beta-farnesene synthase
MTIDRTVDSPARTPVLVPGAWPVLGHAWRMLRDPLGLLESLRDHGDVVTIKLGRKTLHALCTPELVGELLTRRAQSTIVGGPLWEALEDLIGQGVATSNGAVHRRQRRAIQPAFRAERIAGQATMMAEEAGAMVARWQPGQVIDAFQQMFDFATRTVLRSMLSTRSTGREAVEISAALRTVFAGMYRRMLLPASPLYRLPIPANRRFDRALATLHRIVDEIIDERRARDTNSGDLLTALLDSGEPLDGQEIHDQIISVLVAGTETVASTLAWIFPLLSQHPREEARLHREVDAVVGDRPVSVEMLPGLPHTHNVITEAMRLHTGAWIFTRHATAETELGGFRIPAGADMLYSSYALQRDRRSYPRPGTFDPDRWLPEHAAGVPRFAMIPFGAGNRKCPGDNFTMTEAALMLATVASRWRLVPVKATDLTTRIGITLRPRRLLMRVEPRTHIGGRP